MNLEKNVILNRIIFILFFLVTVGFSGYSQNLVDCWHVKSTEKVSETKGGFGGNLELSSQFGNSVARIGDLDNDGVVDLVVGNVLDDESGTNSGAIWVLFIN